MLVPWPIGLFGAFALVFFLETDVVYYGVWVVPVLLAALMRGCGSALVHALVVVVLGEVALFGFIALMVSGYST